jgi:hypothetical protein
MDAKEFKDLNNLICPPDGEHETSHQLIVSLGGAYFWHLANLSVLCGEAPFLGLPFADGYVMFAWRRLPDWQISETS